MKLHIRRLCMGIIAFAIISSFSTQDAKAQIGDIGDFFSAGAADAEALTRAYLSPLPTGVATGLNSGWNGSASARKTLGFNIAIRTSLAFVPTGSQDFDFNELGLTNIELAPGESNILPTLNGDKGGTDVNLFAGSGPGRTQIGSFEIPGGIGFAGVPAPVIEAGIGLIKGTDITIHYLPEIGYDDYGDISLIGGAIKHELTQYLPAEKLIPVDISLMFGYTEMNINADLGGIGQTIEITNSAWVLNALVGKTLPFVSVYGGLGVQGGAMDVAAKGTFTVDSQIVAGGSITDPFDYTEDSDAAVHALAGFRFKLGLIAFYLEGTLAEYSTVNAGLGISFRQ